MRKSNSFLQGSTTTMTRKPDARRAVVALVLGYCLMGFSDSAKEPTDQDPCQAAREVVRLDHVLGPLDANGFDSRDVTGVELRSWLGELRLAARQLARTTRDFTLLDSIEPSTYVLERANLTDLLSNSERQAAVVLSEGIEEACGFGLSPDGAMLRVATNQ